MLENQCYERKIKYLDYMEKGERIRGAGFAKIERQGNRLNLSLTIKELHPADTFEREVLLLGSLTGETKISEIEIGKINIKQGRGEFSFRSDITLCGLAEMTSLEGIRIKLGKEREVSGWWQEDSLQLAAAEPDGQKGQREAKETWELKGQREAKELKEPKGQKEAKETGELKGQREAKGLREPKGQKGAKGLREPKGQEAKESWELKGQKEAKESWKPKGQKGAKESWTPKGQKKLQEQEEQRKNWTNSWEKNSAEQTQENVKDQQNQEDKTQDNRAESAQSDLSNLEAAEYGRKPTVRLSEDKWKQLLAIYPHIRPFRDEREYLSITPSDFVLLSDNAYRRANNSFLLHGYYNYGHLILTRMEKKGEKVFYIGVPGCFYEREKQVAVLFGFESFECAEEPARAGDFGYYMMRTQL